MQVYRILLQRTACVQPLSCDEAYLDITGLGDPLQLAAEIRAEIEATTGCTGECWHCYDGPVPHLQHSMPCHRL